MNCEARVFPSPDPFTVISNDPVGVAGDVLTVRMLVKGGFPEDGLNAATAPMGSPDADNVTVWAVPPTRLTVIVLDPDPPCVTPIPPELDKEKSNSVAGALIVRVLVSSVDHAPWLSWTLKYTVCTPTDRPDVAKEADELNRPSRLERQSYAVTEPSESIP